MAEPADYKKPYGAVHAVLWRLRENIPGHPNQGKPRLAEYRRVLDATIRMVPGPDILNQITDRIQDLSHNRAPVPSDILILDPAQSKNTAYRLQPDGGWVPIELPDWEAGAT